MLSVYFECTSRLKVSLAGNKQLLVTVPTLQPLLTVGSTDFRVVCSCTIDYVLLLQPVQLNTQVQLKCHRGGLWHEIPAVHP